MTRCDSSAPPDSALAGSLDLHEGIAHPTHCNRWPKALRLHSSTGQLVKGRCRSTNKCGYCARLAAVEVSEMLALDAMSGVAPDVWAVLTTREQWATYAQSPERATECAERFNDARRLVMRAIRRRWPDAEYCCILEFTSGRSHQSGGRRFPHWNLLLKGIPQTELLELEAVITSVWCARVDALPAAQFVGAVSEQGGLMRYLALHFLKESQCPPRGWRGHRVTRSRGYLSQPGWRARLEAVASLKLKRALRQALMDGHEGIEALAVAELELQRAEQARWQCVTIEVDGNGELTGITPMMGGAISGPRRAPRLTMGELSPDLFRGIPQTGEKLLEPIANVRHFRYKSGYQRDAERDSANQGQLGDVTAELFSN